MHARFYEMEPRSMMEWGDYGDILQHGMASDLDRLDGLLSLERAGPFLPPITFPGSQEIVLSDSGRAVFEQSNLTGFTFQAVHKSRIVDLAWHEWDLTSDEPAAYPESGEPEDYILQRDPSSAAADELGKVWELVVPITARVGRPRRIVQSSRELYIETATWNGADVFRGDGYGGTFVTENAKGWIEERLGYFVRFAEFRSQ
jgi:hypothetical protein